MAYLFVAASSQKIELSPVPIGNLSAFTVAFWFKSTQTTTARVYSEGNTGSSNQFLSFSFNENITGDMEFQMQDNAATGNFFIATGGISLNDGNWHLAVLSQASKSSREVFIDGTSYGTSSNTLGTITMNTANIGVFRRTTSANYFDGTAGEFAFWNRALSTSEVVSLSKGFSALFFASGLVDYYPLVRGATSVKGGTGTITGATVATHLKIIYPSPQQIRRFTTQQAAAGNNPRFYRTMMGVGF